MIYQIELMLRISIPFEGPIRRPERGWEGSEWEPIKILLEGD
jgi:hypothetical protein